MAKLAHVITGPDGSFESWSDTLPALIGTQLLSMPRSTRKWLDIVHPEDREALRAKSIEAGAAQGGGGAARRLWGGGGRLGAGRPGLRGRARAGRPRRSRGRGRAAP